MRKLKKFKRYAEGGALGAGEGDPFSYTDFSNRARNLKKPEAAPIEERDTSRKAPEPARETKAEKATESAETKPVVKPTVRDTAKDTAETSFDYPKQRDSKRDDYEGDASPTGGGQTFKRDAPKPAGPKAAEKDVKYGGEAIKISSGASGFKFPDKSPAKAPKAASPNEIPGTDVETPYKGEKIDNTGLAGRQFAQSMLGASPALRGASAGIRGVASLGRMLESPKAEGKGTGQFPEAKPEIQVSNKPAVDRVKEANIQGPPKPPRQETTADKMGVRETPSMERMRKAKEAAKEGPPAPAKPQTPAEKMGLKETPSMARMRQAKDTANNMGPPKFYSKEPKPTIAEEFGVKETGPMERARKAKENFDEAADTARKAKPVADDEVVQEAAKRAAASRPRVTPKRQEDSAKFGGGKGTPSKAKTKAEVKPTSNKLKNPVGEKEGPTVDKVLKSKNLEAKKGGKIPAFKKGGLVGRGDGCAMRGKTKGRMV